MYKLIATIQKDFRLLFRDKLGLIFMFVMPVLLAVLITAVQNSTFDLVNNNKISLLLVKSDTGQSATELIKEIEQAGIFEIIHSESATDISENMRRQNAMVGVHIPEGFSNDITHQSLITTNQILEGLGLEPPKQQAGASDANKIAVFYNPVLQESFRYSIRGALNGAVQLTLNKQLIRNLYSTFEKEEKSKEITKQITDQQSMLEESTITLNGSETLPNATQHNIPAWTIFAMFFVVVSLGSSVVKEKTSGSVQRLKTLPTTFLISLVSKQIVYLFVTVLQASVIFLIGKFLFPLMNLPELIIPADVFSVLIVTFFCGLCAVSFALCIGIFADTQEQSNGVGAVSVVLLAATGGIIVPAFVLPDAFAKLLNFSPMHWCLEAYYILFLEHGKFKDIFTAIIPLLCIIFALQIICFIGLRRKNLI